MCVCVCGCGCVCGCTFELIYFLPFIHTQQGSLSFIRSPAIWLKVLWYLVFSSVQPHRPGRVAHAAVHVVVIPSDSRLCLIGRPIMANIVAQGQRIAHHGLLLHTRANPVPAARIWTRPSLAAQPLPPLEASALPNLPLANTVVAALCHWMSVFVGPV